MPFELPPDPRAERRTRVTRWVSFALAALLIATVSYLLYVGFEGSRQLSDAPNPTADCRTPATMGWQYESIGYDIATDSSVAAEPDPTACGQQGSPADGSVSVDEIALAGWYVPSATGGGPGAPTVVVAHGWGLNKSAMLDRAALLHDAYNLLLFDFRNHGQSSDAATTQGVREAAELRAMIDWLEREKGPSTIGVLGVSMGGVTALEEADRDDRIDGLIVESGHATLANAAQARLDRSGYPLSTPGSWAILLGALIRTGEDVSSVDPVQTARRLDNRPLLLIHGDMDESIGPDDADAIFAAASEAGSPTELRICPGAGHGRSPEVCAEDYAAWVLGFLERVLAPPG